MRNKRTILVPALFVIASVLSLSVVSRAQNREKFVISARAGGVNAVTGRATMRPHGNSEWRVLTIKEDLETGDTVRTDRDGRVEMLLNPGSYLRVGENAEFELADNSLENLEVKLTRGTAIVEVTGADDAALFIGITTPHAHMSIIRRGLYRVSVVPGDTTELIVRKGRVVLEDSHTKVKGGDKVTFSSRAFSVAALNQADKKGTDNLETWSKERAQTLAKANSRISGRALTTIAMSFRNDWSYGGVWGRPGFWLFNRDIGCYTFMPFGYGWGSPYGSSYARFFYGPDGVYSCCGRGQLHSAPIFTDPVTGAVISSGGSGGGSAPASASTPGRGLSETPMTSLGKPDLSPGGEGPGLRRPIKE
jgi:hypothetical protein